eukprot:977148-Alexandrium_andersonii.AAC.1
MTSPAPRGETASSRSVHAKQSAHLEHCQIALGGGAPRSPQGGDPGRASGRPHTPRQHSKQGEERGPS